jgi:hypothetical protein
MKALFVVLALAAALVGCGDDAEQEAKATPTPTGGRLVIFERGGGIAAQPQTLDISRDGEAKLTIRTGPDISHRDFSLSQTQLSDLETALDDAQGVEVPKVSYACADCFIYVIEADGIKFQLDSVSYSDEATPVELIRLTAALEKLAGN